MLSAARNILHALEGRAVAHKKVSAAEASRVAPIVQSTSLSMAELGKIGDAVRSVGFAADDVAQLLDVVGARAADSAMALPVNAGNRVAVQNFTNFVNYLPQSLWELLRVGEVDRFLVHMVSLGLRNPSEATSQFCFYQNGVSPLVIILCFLNCFSVAVLLPLLS